MAFITLSRVAEIYAEIRRRANGCICPVLVFVAATVDGLCALRIFTELLKADYIPYKVVPVSGYEDLERGNDYFIQGRNDFRSVVLIDCGGTIDLAEKLSLTPEMSVYVIDSHRPYSLFNIFNNSQLFILDDGFIENNLNSLQMAYEFTMDENQLENDNDNQSIDGEEYDPSDDNTIELTLDQMRQRMAVSRLRECRRHYEDYFRDGSWYGVSVARLFFEMADGMGRQCNDFLWWGILGITAQQIMERITRKVYDEQVAWLRERCLALNKDDRHGNSGSRSARADDQSSPSIVNPMSRRDGTIRYEWELRFMLHRHWSLFNGMLHSRYLATRLGVWRDRGRRLLETFIVKMGLPLAQCKLDFQSMDVEYKETLPKRIGKYAGEFGLHDVSFPSFSRDYGFVMRVSASDAVYALMALTETPLSLVDRRNTSAITVTSPSASSTLEQSPVWITNFWYAFEALDNRAVEKIRRGIALAMHQQQVILHEATTILAHRLLKYGRRFRYVVLRKGAEIAWLAGHAFSLAKLALFLRDATRNSPRSHTPLVVAAYYGATGTYFVVATSTDDINSSNNNGEQSRNHNTSDGGLAATTLDGGPRNKFGMAFRRAAQMVRARVQHDGFDTSVIEVRAEDLKPLLQTLQTIPII